MKLQSIKKGFTLIELLVVITIIGILATGATTVFTAQIQKARDTTRITSLNALKGAIEQVYQDTSEYPKSNEFLTGASINVSTYMETIPKDPKNGQLCNNNGSTTVFTVCALSYVVGDDANSIAFGSYEISTGFENQGNVEAKAKADNGNDDLKLEMGTKTADLETAQTTAYADTAVLGACTDGTTVPVSGEAGEEVLIVINGGGDCTVEQP